MPNKKQNINFATVKEIEPIAFFRSPLTSKFGIPRQSGLAHNLGGRIVFEKRLNLPFAHHA